MVNNINQYLFNENVKKKRPSVVKEARISNYPIKLNSIIKKEEVNEPLPWVVSIKDNNEKK